MFRLHRQVGTAQFFNAEGKGTHATGTEAHAEGLETYAVGSYSHAEGTNTVAAAPSSHAQNSGTIASASGQTAMGTYNTAMNEDYCLVIGNGSGDSDRHNAFAMKWNGNIVLADGTELTVAQLKKITTL